MDAVQAVLSANACIRAWSQAASDPNTVAALAKCCACNLGAALAAGLAQALANATDDAASVAVSAIATLVEPTERMQLCDALVRVRACTAAQFASVVEHSLLVERKPASPDLDAALSIGLSAVADTGDLLYKQLCERVQDSAERDDLCASAMLLVRMALAETTLA